MRPARARARALGTLLALLLAALAACGGGGNGDAVTGADGAGIGILDPSLDPDAGIAPEDVRLSANEAAAGLRVLKDLADSATKALGANDMELLPEDAPALQAQIATSWQTVAATVKENDAATHAALEEAFPAFGAAIGAKDQAAARAEADRIAAAVDAYLARFPPGPGVEMPTEPQGDGSMPDFGPQDFEATAPPDAESDADVDPVSEPSGSPAPS